MDGKERKELQNLLKFAIQHQGEPATESSELDPEKKLFLENVLNTMTSDVKQELLNAIFVLENNNSSDKDKVTSLDIIRDVVDNIDFANSFVKMGGTEVLLNCVSCKNKAIRANSINALAELAQNNPFCQQHFLSCGVMEILVEHLDDGHESVVASSLYALTALVASFDPASKLFTSGSAAPAVLRCLDSPSSRVFTKACFLISSLSSQFPHIRDKFVKNNTLEKLSENLEVVADFDIKAESLLSAMATLAPFASSTVDPDLLKHVVDSLASSLATIKDLPQCEEMTGFAEIILKHLNGPPS